MKHERLLPVALVMAALSQASASAQSINEVYMSHTGTDDQEMIELNAPANYILDNHMVLIVEGQSTLSGTLDRAWDLTGLNFDPVVEFFVLGDTAVTPKDFDIGSSNRIENGTETIYFIDAGSPANVATITGWVGTNVDLDLDTVTDIATLPGVVILDLIAPISSTSDVTYDGARRLGPDGSNFPAGIFRAVDASWCCGSWLDFDDVANLAEPRTIRAINSGCPTALTLNEVYASHAGTDNLEMIELKGPAGCMLDNHMVLIVEGQASGTPGTLDRAWDLSSTAFAAGSEYFVLGDTAVTPKDFDIGGSNRIENGTETIYLIDAGSAANVSTISGWVGTNIDLDLDLVTDIATLPGVVIVDIIAPISDETDSTYDGALRLGPDGSNFPAGIFRDADGPWSCTSWLDFDEVANATEPRTVRGANSAAPAVYTTYCTAGTSNIGCVAQISAVGTPSATAQDGFVITVGQMEGSRQGLIFYGITGTVAFSWGSGSSYLCVKAPVKRTPWHLSGGTQGVCDGALVLDWNAFRYSKPNAIGNPFSPGDMVWAQGWFRDPQSPKTTSLSNGIEFTVCP